MENQVSTGEAMLLAMIMSLAKAAKVDPKKFASIFSKKDYGDYMKEFTIDSLTTALTTKKK